MRAQASLEFMVMLFAIVLLVSIAAGIAAMNLSEADAVNDRLAAQKLCGQVSATFASLAANGANGSYAFNLTPSLNGKNYAIYVSSGASLVKVDYNASGLGGAGGVGCATAKFNAANSANASFFVLQPNASVSYDGEVLRIVP
ncbi:MAG: hypothetical protein M1530_00425 [Candidatus Marsarchaeota archaeon]|nr:hypothetical protein [Candidatus Marsarchaeota archaeon]